MCTYVYPKAYTKLFIVAVFIITKKGKQPTCPSSRMKNKLQYILQLNTANENDLTKTAHNSMDEWHKCSE